MFNKSFGKAVLASTIGLIVAATVLMFASKHNVPFAGDVGDYI